MNRIVTGDGRVHFASCTHINRAAPLSDVDAAWLGERCDVVTAGPRTLQGKEGIVAAQGAELGEYSKSNQTSNGTYSEEFYSHKRGGERRWNAAWHVYSAQPDGAWRDAHLAELKRLPAWSTAVFSDSAGMYSYSQGGKPAKPPAHTAEYTPGEWLALVGSNLSYWQDQTGKRFLVNGLSRETVDVYRPTVGMLEGAFGTNRGVMPTQAKWEDTAGLILEAQAKGWTPWCLGKLAGGADRDPLRRDAWRALLAPSMLLLDAGSLLFDLCGMEGSDPPWVTREYDHPSYAPGIGLPLVMPTSLTDLETTWSGVYKRQFERGSVWVNATTSPVQLTRTRLLEPQSGRFWKRTVRRRP